MTIAGQTAVGEIGSKATTELSYSFASLLNIGGFQYGAGENGLFRLNTGEADNGINYTRSCTLATSDYGVSNPKRARFIYIGFDASFPFMLSVKIDEQAWRDYTVTPRKVGIQRIRVPIGRNGQGRYFTIKVSSTRRFIIDQMDGMFIVRSSGIKGY
jgi:hypothetical protein